MESKWQPIETAPKDGTWILIFACGEYVALFDDDFNQWNSGDELEVPYEPTHWMPLPKPPEE